MYTLTFKDFNKKYLGSVDQVLRYWTPEMQREISVHNYGWAPELFDFKTYLNMSSLRFYKAYSSFARRGIDQKVCDIGGFLGAFPVTLCAIGFDVTMTETTQYYSNSFKDLFSNIAEMGVKIVDYDPFARSSPLQMEFDVITVMAVLEHYPHSLNNFINNIISGMRTAGLLYIEVPNVAYWPKRVNLMLGKTPNVPLIEIFKSDIPFIGHHHEFAMAELRDLAELSDLKICREEFYNYSDQRKLYARFIYDPLKTIINLVVPDTRECLAIECKRRC